MSTLSNPTDNEAPLVALVKIDYSTMSEDAIAAHVAKIRALRGVGAQKTAAAKKSERSVKSNVDLNQLL